MVKGSQSYENIVVVVWQALEVRRSCNCPELPGNLTTNFHDKLCSLQVFLK